MATLVLGGVWCLVNGWPLPSTVGSARADADFSAGVNPSTLGCPLGCSSLRVRTPQAAAQAGGRPACRHGVTLPNNCQCLRLSYVPFPFFPPTRAPQQLSTPPSEIRQCRKTKMEKSALPDPEPGTALGVSGLWRSSSQLDQTEATLASVYGAEKGQKSGDT